MDKQLNNTQPSADARELATRFVTEVAAKRGFVAKSLPDYEQAIDDATPYFQAALTSREAPASSDAVGEVWQQMEVRTDIHTKAFDEFIGTNVDVHIEVLDDRNVWASFTRKDGERFCLNFMSAGKGRTCIKVDVTEQPKNKLPAPAHTAAKDAEIARLTAALKEAGKDFAKLEALASDQTTKRFARGSMLAVNDALADPAQTVGEVG